MTDVMLVLHPTSGPALHLLAPSHKAIPKCISQIIYFPHVLFSAHTKANETGHAWRQKMVRLLPRIWEAPAVQHRKESHRNAQSATP